MGFRLQPMSHSNLLEHEGGDNDDVVEVVPDIDNWDLVQDGDLPRKM